VTAPDHPPFDEPWQARVFGMAVATCEAEGWDWDEMRDRLKAAVSDAPERPYYESLLAAFERLLADKGVSLPA
jgi:nitrile hydratase accessory protein